MPLSDTRVNIDQEVEEIQPGAKVIGLSTGPVQGGVTVTTNTEGSASSWLQWGQHVLKELVRLNECIARLEDRIHDLERGTVGDEELQRCADDLEDVRNKAEDLRRDFVEMRTKALLIATVIGAVIGIVADVIIRRLLGA
jgi:hypothetical protein